ncbi:hypothetical protein LI291_10460 [Intestinibacillus massiliensis]|nr:hypothetical protein [Intestinibacillus massiliensis]
MRKIVSVMAAVGMVAALSASAFAAQLPIASNGVQPPKTPLVGVTELGEGVSIDDVAKDDVLAPSNPAPADLGEAAANPGAVLGAGASASDTAKDIR